MNDLLNLAVEAHGGLKRWSQLTVMKASPLHHMAEVLRETFRDFLRP
jgi:hypothetical protein